MVNVNIRAAAGEYTAMTFLPLIVAGMYMIYTSEKPSYKEWRFLTFGMAGVIMSHVVTGEIIVINLLLLCLILIKKNLKKRCLFFFYQSGIFMRRHYGMVFNSIKLRRKHNSEVCASS